MDKIKENVEYGTAKVNETFEHGTREIGRIAHDVTLEIKKVAERNDISSPLPSDCASEIKKAANVLNFFIEKNTIPKDVFLNAKGLAIFTAWKAGIFWTGRVGSGVIIARTPKGLWSPPSCINVMGVGFGPQAGADFTNFVLVLNTEEAVKAFSRGDNVTLGGNLSVSAGPIGMGAGISSSIYEPSALYSYSYSKGFFAGVSVEGTIIMERKTANKQFYGKDISVEEILSGKFDVTPSATENELYNALKRIERKGDDSQKVNIEKS